jgi:toxin HigB-1
LQATNIPALGHVPVSWYHEDMIKSFQKKGSLEIASGAVTKESRRTLPIDLHRRARRLMAELDFAITLKDLERPSNRLHSLSGDRKGQYAISINDQYRICFIWRNGDATKVEITDYH